MNSLPSKNPERPRCDAVGKTTNARCRKYASTTYPSGVGLCTRHSQLVRQHRKVVLWGDRTPLEWSGKRRDAIPSDIDSLV